LLPLPLVIAAGATLQTWVGAVLVRRYVQQPLVLQVPRDIFKAGALGALLACVVSPSVATAAMWWAGVLPTAGVPATWLTWWLGDSMGVLIGGPLTLTIIGQPRADWRPRRRTLGLPLLGAMALLTAGMLELSRVDQQRLRANFERDADRLASAAQERLTAPLYALQALHGAALARGDVDQTSLRYAASWWLAQPLQMHLQAVGHSVRVPLDGVAAFEAAARAQGMPGYRVFDRDEGRARVADGEVVALRHIEPLAGNAAALGVNALSIPAARTAILAARDTGTPGATAGFKLTQGEIGVVLYQALYRGEHASLASRRDTFRGVVFVTINTERAFSALAPAAQAYVEWCLLDVAPGAAQPRLAGPANCDSAKPTSRFWQLERPLQLGGRGLVLRLWAAPESMPGAQREAAWLLSIAGLTAAALLGALLLTVTGQHRRTALAVTAGTAELRHQVAERTQAEQALRESEARLRSIVDHVPLGVMFLAPDGSVLDCNPRLCDMLGRSADALKGSSVAQMVHPSELDLVLQQRRDLLAGAELVSMGPLRLDTPNGALRQVRVNASALRDASGQVVRLVGVVEDVTEHLRLEASEKALQRAEAANRAKSDFLSRMSHELRTPLNAINGFAQLLEMDRQPTLAAHQLGWTQQILRAGWHLLEMINETLDLARIEAGTIDLNLVPVDLAAMVAASRSLVAGTALQRGIQFSEDLTLDAPAVLGDATRLKQVLTNLLSNAVKYNRPQGQVVISSRLADDDHVEIEVTDTGLGMTDSQLAALFQPYNRLGRESSGIEGTGIGLVISRRLAELMGGSLTAQSQAGTGTAFTLRLPVATAEASPPPRFTDTSPAPYLRRLVHYVEDNQTNIEVMRGVLAQRAQIDLHCTLLGLDGLAAMRHEQPDLILLDMHLPDISGLELLRHIKQDQTLAAVPVIVVSADATPDHMQAALTLGAAHYVTKPLDLALFLQLVDGVLEHGDTRWGALP
jgi:PAS domain S-box-containing protein